MSAATVSSNHRFQDGRSSGVSDTSGREVTTDAPSNAARPAIQPFASSQYTSRVASEGGAGSTVLLPAFVARATSQRRTPGLVHGRERANASTGAPVGPGEHRITRQLG